MTESATPHGAVTLMFTDIEGSTKLLERLRERYALVLEQQRDILRAAFDRHGGHEVDTQGDSFFVAFSSAAGALACAVEIQRELAAHEWPDGVQLRVRVGVHTGEPQVAATGYVGIDVHRGARIGAAAHGGQVLASEAARDDAASALPSEVELESLGKFRFKGLADPLAVFEVHAPGLATDFPPINTSPPEDEPPAAGDPPYKGLLRFEEEDAERFFGREELVQQIVAATSSEPFLAVVGASGSGKSSLIRAGVIPALKAGNGARVAITTPTADPRAQLASALAGNPTVLVVDQFEELFTLCRDEGARTEFVSLMIAAIAGGVRVLITLRADFYASIGEFDALRTLVAEHQVYAGPMDIAGLRRAIEGPARLGGWEIAPGLVDLLLRDVGSEPGALPLLSHALLETWSRRRGSRMTLKGYFESGEVRGAIAKTADRLYAELSSSEQLAAREILLRLTELGEGTQDTRRRARLDELVSEDAGSAETADILRRLVDARLVTVDEGAAEVAHEALIREWPLLRTWLHENREGLRTQRQITESAAEWDALSREPSLLFRGARLAIAREWADAHPRSVTARERAFIDASIGEEERDQRERAEQQQRALDAERRRAEEQLANNRRLRRRAFILAGAVVIAAALGVAAVIFAGQASEQATNAQAQATRANEQRDLADVQRKTALSRQLAAQATTNLAEPDLSLLLALEGLRAADTAEARASLLGGLLTEPQLETVLFQTRRISGAAQSDDGSVVAVGLENGGVELWDVVDRVELGTIPSLGGPAPFALSGDGSLVAVAAPTGDTASAVPIQEWSTRPVKLVQSLLSPACGVEELVLNHSADRLAVTCGDTATLYALPGQHAEELPCRIVTPAFDPTGAVLALACPDGSVVLNDLAAGTSRRLEHVPDVVGLGFSRDGVALAVTYAAEGSDATTTIWDAQSAQVLRTFAPEAGTGSEFVGAGHDVVALTTSDKTVLWNVATGETMGDVGCTGQSEVNPSATLIAVACTSAIEVHELRGLELKATLPVDLTASAFTLETMSFIGGDDRIGTLRYNDFAGSGAFKVWNLDQPATIAQHLVAAGQSGPGAVSVSPDLKYAVAVTNGQLTLWDVGQQQEIAALAPVEVSDEAEPFGVFSADSRVLAYGALGATVVHLWDVGAGQALPDVAAGGDGVRNLVLNQDGSKLELGNSAEVAVWDLHEQRPLAHLDQRGDLPPAFSPDGGLLALEVANSKVALFDTTTGAMIGQPFGDHERTISNLAFSPDGKLLATASLDQTVRLWDVTTRQRVGVPLAHRTGVVNVLFSPDSKTVASAAWGEDRSVSLWNVADGALIGRLPDTIGFFMSFATDGRRLAAYGTDGNIIVWDIDLADWQSAACRVANRNLTQVEWQRFIPDEPYHATCIVSTTEASPAPSFYSR